MIAPGEGRCLQAVGCEIVVPGEIELSGRGDRAVIHLDLVGLGEGLWRDNENRRGEEEDEARVDGGVHGDRDIVVSSRPASEERFLGSVNGGPRNDYARS